MTADVCAAGAASHAAEGWTSIDWKSAYRIVCRLQARIVKAIQEGRWGKVKALQYLLTHSFSGKALAARRVTENQGKATPGVDREIWDTPEKKAAALQALRPRGYHPQPLRRVYIPKSNGKMRPLGIPVCRSYCTSSQGGWGIPEGPEFGPSRYASDQVPDHRDQWRRVG
jgi:RNA-directed DNA polymerase